MMIQIGIALSFYVVFVFYVLLGIYCITLNIKAKLNRVFLFICCCLSIWAFAFAISNSLNNYEEVLFWRRTASLGWGMAFSAILHFIMILTEEIKLFKIKGIYFFIYLPAAINVFVFGLFSKIASEQYNLVHTVAGWGNISLNNFWDIYYNYYYITFSFITLGMLIRWYRKSNSVIKKKNALYLIISFGVSVVLGSLTEMLLNSFLSFKVPSLAPFIILIPMVTIFFNIKKYGLMHAYDKRKLSLEGALLSDDKHGIFIRDIAFVFFIGSLLNLFHYFFYSTELSTVMLFSTVFVLLGSMIFVLPYLGMSTIMEEYALGGIIAISIPLILLEFLDNYASNIVWSVPLIFMLITIIFNNKKIFWSIAGISLLTGIWSWVRVPKLAIQVGALDYISRLVFYGMIIILAAYINKCYIFKVKENDKQVEFQKIISSISTSLVTITSSNFDDKITELLEKSGCYILADRSYLGLLSEDQQMINYTHKWLREGITPLLEHSEENQFVPLNWSNSKLSANKIVFIPDVEELPPEAIMEKKIMLSQGIKSLISIPISSKNKVIGVLRFDQIKTQKGWRIEDRDLLKVLTNMLAEAITKVKVEKEISYLAYYDALTGLPNRTLISGRLEQAIPLARRNEKMIGVIFIDLDGFKSVNDTMGHNWGDNLLKQVADRLSQCITKYGTVARFGGDEFLIMIPQIFHVKDVENVANNVMKIFNSPIIVNKQEFFLTASAGIALFPQDGEEANILIKNADIAMYSAKNNGKGQYIFCTSEMKDNVLKKMMLTNSLYRALDRNELVLNYQPQVSIDTKEIIGMEALIRWDHPDLGRIPPNIFIPIAEQTGLINAIGEWVLNTACMQNKIWQDLGFKPIQMAVNVSVEQFRSGKLKQIVEECLEKTGLDPRYLELEITEGIAMKETDYILKALHDLKLVGISISIDDFGTEFSSLSRLKDLPVDRLKIDMQFVRGIAVNSKDEAIIKVIINLARRLGLKVIAEGVETEEQLKFLTDEACDEVQGYYYYKPMPSEEVVIILE
jgi:diguanylate cyclase (GGDEF)-like protein